MELRAALLKEHSKKQAQAIAAHIGHSPERFGELMQLFLKGEYRLTQRAAWVMSSCVQNNPGLILPYLPQIINMLEQQAELHDAVKRNTLRVLQDIEIPARLMGRLANVCFRYLHSAEEAVAIKVFSMSVLLQICQAEPDLKNELIPILEDMLPYGSAAIRSRGKKVLAALYKL